MNKIKCPTCGEEIFPQILELNGDACEILSICPCGTESIFNFKWDGEAPQIIKTEKPCYLEILLRGTEDND